MVQRAVNRDLRLAWERRELHTKRRSRFKARCTICKTDGLLSVRRKRPFPTGKRTLPSNGHFSQTPSSELDDLSRLSLTTARSARAHEFFFFNAGDSYPAMFSTTPQPSLSPPQFQSTFRFTCITKKRTQRTPGHPRPEGVNLSHFQRENMPPFFWVTRGKACEAGLVMVVMAVIAVMVMVMVVTLMVREVVVKRT
jgi:hypothetical protein